MKPSPSLVLAATLALLLAGCQGTPAPTVAPMAPTVQPIVASASPVATPNSRAATEAAAVVNGQAITMASYEAQVQAAIASYSQQPGVDPESADGQAALAALRQQVLEWLIDQALVDQAAERGGIAVDEAQVRAAAESIRTDHPDDFAAWLAANGFTEETFRAQVRSDLLGAAVRDRVMGQVGPRMEQVHLRHILVESEAEARALLAQIQQGTAVAALAAAHSIDESSRTQGGDLGFLPRGVLPEELERVAFGLQPGQAAGPVQSRIGWHVVQVVARDAARDVPPELLAALRQEAFMRWLEGERERATIERLVGSS